MEKESEPSATKNLVQWAITPPQSYGVYLIALFLVTGLSYYAGSLNPKKHLTQSPPPISAPQN